MSAQSFTGSVQAKQVRNYHQQGHNDSRNKLLEMGIINVHTYTQYIQGDKAHTQHKHTHL